MCELFLWGCAIYGLSWVLGSFVLTSSPSLKGGDFRSRRTTFRPGK